MYIKMIKKIVKFLNIIDSKLFELYDIILFNKFIIFEYFVCIICIIYRL